MDPMIPTHTSLRLWLDLSEALAVAAVMGARRVHAALRPRRTAGYRIRRPGFESPMWNVCVKMLRQALEPHGAKVRLARYLGVPKQRVYDFLTGRSRLPDAELTLRLIHWLAEHRAGRDPSL